MMTPEASTVLSHVASYLRQLGLNDTKQIENIAKHCIVKANVKVKPGSTEELSRRALEEAQKYFNKSIARILHLSETLDSSKIASARAALLLCQDAGNSSKPDEFNQTLCKILPIATPQEAPLSMPEQPISFFFEAP